MARLNAPAARFVDAARLRPVTFVTFAMISTVTRQLLLTAILVLPRVTYFTPSYVRPHRPALRSTISGAPSLRIAPLVPLILLAVAPTTPLRPGLWRFTNMPGAETLDGRALHGLPVGPVTSERCACLPARPPRPRAGSRAT